MSITLVQSLSHWGSCHGTSAVRRRGIWQKVEIRLSFGLPELMRPGCNRASNREDKMASATIAWAAEFQWWSPAYSKSATMLAKIQKEQGIEINDLIASRFSCLAKCPTHSVEISSVCLFGRICVSEAIQGESNAVRWEACHCWQIAKKRIDYRHRYIHSRGICFSAGVPRIGWNILLAKDQRPEANPNGLAFP